MMSQLGCTSASGYTRQTHQNFKVLRCESCPVKNEVCDFTDRKKGIVSRSSKSYGYNCHAFAFDQEAFGSSFEYLQKLDKKSKLYPCRSRLNTLQRLYVNSWIVYKEKEPIILVT